jgi:tRNA(Ile)-lysidine synthase
MPDPTPRRPVLLRRLEAAVSELGLAGRRLAVAVSGGVDSISLLHGLEALARAHGLVLSVAHVHHGLRGAEADADQALVSAAAASLELPFAAERVDPRAAVAAAPSSRERPSLEEAARRLRREALVRLAERLGAERIATAHTADDQAETLLLRLLRGTGPAGLGGIPPSAGPLVRPLLRTSRAEVLVFARARGLAWREDASNVDPRHARSRLRQAWLPGLRDAFNPRLLRALCDLAETMREESAWAEASVEREAGRRFRTERTEDGTTCLWMEAKDWDRDVLPDAPARRLARRALHQMGAGRDVTRAHLDRMIRFLRRGRVGRAIELPGGLRLARDARGFRLARVGLPSRGAC